MSDLIKTLKSSETGDNVYPNIKEDNIPSGAVKTAKIDDGAVTTEKLADSSVTTAKINNGSVTTAKLDGESVTTEKIGAMAVTTAKIDIGAVTSSKIGDSAVTSAKINEGAVSYNKLATALKNLIDGKASQTDLETLQTALNTHVGNTSNPHSVTKTQVGLGNVDNTSDANKPVSTATQVALDGKQDKIDSTHKLDADLVDDSTSNNKFTTTSNLSKLSGIESGAEVNTIETISVNGTPVTPDANRNVNIITGGGGGSVSLYLHTLYISGEDESTDSIYVYVNIINASSTPFTLQAFKNLMALSSSNAIAVSGFRNNDIIVAMQYNGETQWKWTFSFQNDNTFDIREYEDITISDYVRAL